MLSVLYSAALLTAAADPAPPADEAIGRLLVGTWATGTAGAAAGDPKGTVRYDAGGTFAAAGDVAVGGGVPVRISVEGTWAVEGGVVRLSVTRSSHPGIVPVGGATKETVVGLDQKVLRVRRGLGPERVRQRVGGE